LILIPSSQPLQAFLTLQRLIISGILLMEPQRKPILPFSIHPIQGILMFSWLLITGDVLTLCRLIHSFTSTLRYRNLQPDETLYCNPWQDLPVEVSILRMRPFMAKLQMTFLMIWEWGDGMPNDTLDDPELDDLDMGNFSHFLSQDTAPIPLSKSFIIILRVVVTARPGRSISLLSVPLFPYPMIPFVQETLCFCLTRAPLGLTHLLLILINCLGV